MGPLGQLQKAAHHTVGGVEHAQGLGEAHLRQNGSTSGGLLRGLPEQRHPIPEETLACLAANTLLQELAPAEDGGFVVLLDARLPSGQGQSHRQVGVSEETDEREGIPHLALPPEQEVRQILRRGVDESEDALDPVAGPWREGDSKPAISRPGDERRCHIRLVEHAKRVE